MDYKWLVLRTADDMDDLRKKYGVPKIDYDRIEKYRKKEKRYKRLQIPDVTKTDIKPLVIP